MKLKVLFYGQFTIRYDYGGQGLAYPILDYLKQHFDVEPTFAISEKHYEVNKDYCKRKGFKMAKFSHPKFWKSPELEEAIKNTDLIIDVEGLEFNGGKPFIKKWFHLFRINNIQHLANKYNKKYIKSPKSFGPFNSKLYKSIIKNHLNKLPFVLVRGNTNFELIKELNLEVPVYKVPDVAFLVEPTDKKIMKDYLRQVGCDLDKPTIGISPSFVLNNKIQSRHKRKIKEKIYQAQKQEKQILLIPHAINNTDDPYDCDLALCKEIIFELEDSKDVYLVEDLDLEYKDIRSIIGCLEFYITGRYHGLISAIVMGTPYEVISWHSKYEDVTKIKNIKEARKKALKALERIKDYVKAN